MSDPRIIVGNLESIQEEWGDAHVEGYKLLAVTQVGTMYTLFLVQDSEETSEYSMLGSLQAFQDEYAHIQG